MCASSIPGSRSDGSGCGRPIPFLDLDTHFKYSWIKSKFLEQSVYISMQTAEHSTPYTPSANGQLERYNWTLMDAVRCFVEKPLPQWDKHLAQIAGALTSVVNHHTAYTLNMLILGREINHPANLMF